MLGHFSLCAAVFGAYVNSSNNLFAINTLPFYMLFSHLVYMTLKSFSDTLDKPE